MYKLTIVSGPNSGASYSLVQGETSIGRQAGNTIVLTSTRISKRHCTLQIEGSQATLTDCGSSNGTFVNGILTKTKKIRPGDKISVGEFVFELSGKSLLPAPRQERGSGGLVAVESMGDLMSPQPLRTGTQSRPPGLSSSGLAQGSAVDIAKLPEGPPQDLKGKLIWMFEHRIMPMFYRLNLKHEWNVLLAMGIFSILIGNLVISVYPLIQSGRTSLLKETGARARYMARQIADANTSLFATRNETKVDVGNVENAEGVRFAAILDMDSRIMAPSGKMNTYLSSGPEAKWAIVARDRFRNGQENGFWKELDGDQVTAIEPIRIVSNTVGKNVTVAMALVTLDASLNTLDSSEVGMIYSETFILTGLFGAFVLLVLYRLTLKPLLTLNEELDRVLKGDLPSVTQEFKFHELDSLWDLIRSAIQRIPKAGEGAQDFGSGGGMDPARWAEENFSSVKTVGELASFGVVFFDAEKKIVYLNSAFEEISGIRNDSAVGQEIFSVARDQAMASFTADLLGRIRSGSSIVEDFDFSGVAYKVHASGFGGSSGVLKGYLLCVVRSEG